MSSSVTEYISSKPSPSMKTLGIQTTPAAILSGFLSVGQSPRERHRAHRAARHRIRVPLGCRDPSPPCYGR